MHGPFLRLYLAVIDDWKQCIVQNAAALGFGRAWILETTGNTPWLNKTHGRRSMQQIWNHKFAKGVTSLENFVNHCTLVVAASMPHVKKCNSQRSLVLNSHIALFKGTSLKFAKKLVQLSIVWFCQFSFHLQLTVTNSFPGLSWRTPSVFRRCHAARLPPIRPSWRRPGVAMHKGGSVTSCSPVIKCEAADLTGVCT